MKYVILRTLRKRTLQATILSVTKLLMLSAFASNRRDDWDLWLDSVTFAYNTSRHDALSISPYVVFNQLPRLPVKLKLGMTQSENLVSVRMAFKDGILGCKTHSRGTFVKSIQKAGTAQSADKHLVAFQIGRNSQVEKTKRLEVISGWGLTEFSTGLG